MSGGSGDVAIFMSYQGIRGEALTPASVSSSPAGGGWIQLNACHFGAKVGLGQRNSSPSEFEHEGAPVRIGKQTDGSTIPLLQKALLGAFDSSVVIVFLRTGQGAPVEHLRLEMLNCGIVQTDMDGDGEDRAGESYAIRYGEMSVITWAFDGGGRRAQSVAVMRNEV